MYKKIYECQIGLLRLSCGWQAGAMDRVASLMPLNFVSRSITRFFFLFIVIAAIVIAIIIVLRSIFCLLVLMLCK